MIWLCLFIVCIYICSSLVYSTHIHILISSCPYTISSTQNTIFRKCANMYSSIKSPAHSSKSSSTTNNIQFCPISCKASIARFIGNQYLISTPSELHHSCHRARGNEAPNTMDVVSECETLLLVIGTTSLIALGNRCHSESLAYEACKRIFSRVKNFHLGTSSRPSTPRFIAPVS
jgi:hypothetical protein